MNFNLERIDCILAKYVTTHTWNVLTFEALSQLAACAVPHLVFRCVFHVAPHGSFRRVWAWLALGRVFRHSFTAERTSCSSFASGCVGPSIRQHLILYIKYDMSSSDYFEWALAKGVPLANAACSTLLPSLLPPNMICCVCLIVPEGQTLAPTETCYLQGLHLHIFVSCNFSISPMMSFISLRLKWLFVCCEVWSFCKSIGSGWFAAPWRWTVSPFFSIEDIGRHSKEHNVYQVWLNIEPSWRACNICSSPKQKVGDPPTLEIVKPGFDFIWKSFIFHVWNVLFVKKHWESMKHTIVRHEQTSLYRKLANPFIALDLWLAN